MDISLERSRDPAEVDLGGGVGIEIGLESLIRAGRGLRVVGCRLGGELVVGVGEEHLLEGRHRWSDYYSSSQTHPW